MARTGKTPHVQDQAAGIEADKSADPAPAGTDPVPAPAAGKPAAGPDASTIPAEAFWKAAGKFSRLR